MAELKTKENEGNVEEFLNTIDNEQSKEDSKTILKLMQKTTGEKPKMWGKSIIGFGSYHYKYETGREGDWYKVGLSPRKQNLTIYISNGFGEYDKDKSMDKFLEKLGKVKLGKGCMYINKIEDIDLKVLEDLIKHSYSKKFIGEV